MPNLTIISDGRSTYTYIFDHDGKELRGVVAVSWSIEAGKPSTAVVTFEDVAVNVQGAGV